MKVPFVDLKVQFALLREEILPAVESVMQDASFVLGEQVDLFEQEFAVFCGAKHCVSVGSGCDALLAGLKAVGVGPGDEVVLPANTYIATALAVSACGAVPVLVDCVEDTYEIDVAAAERAVTAKTKAIIPVHLYGHPADMDAIMALADSRNVRVIEDAAQAHGAMYKGRPCGSTGDVGCFSFYPGKNLGAYGDGGAIVTNDDDIAEYVRRFRNYGQKVKYHHEMVGWNTRLDSIQAAVLRVKLKHITDWNRLRASNADKYRTQLAGSPVTLPVVAPECTHIYHLFVIRCERRDDLMAYLNERDIQSGIHYPIPIHLQSAYAELGLGVGSLPVTEKAAGEIVSLPMFPELTDEQIGHVCEGVRGFLADE